MLGILLFFHLEKEHQLWKGLYGQTLESKFFLGYSLYMHLHSEGSEKYCG